MRHRLYRGSYAPTAQTAAVDAWEIIAAAAGLIALAEFRIWQTSDFGDSEEEILDIIFYRGTGTYTSGSGGATPTARNVDYSGVAASMSLEGRNTTQAAAGTGALTEFARMGWNVREQGLWLPGEEEEDQVEPTDAIVIAVPAPADSLTWGSSVLVQEVGT